MTYNKLISIVLLLIVIFLLYNFMTSWIVIIVIYIGVYLTGINYFSNKIKITNPIVMK